MAIYALYVPSARQPCANLAMEKLPSKELTERLLKERVSTGRSKTFYLHGPDLDFRQRPVKAWPVWDGSGYFRIWPRRAADPVPDLLSRPDEQWVVNDTGKVERLPWGEDRVALLRAAGPRSRYAAYWPPVRSPQA